MKSDTHLINTGMTYKGSYIFIQTNRPGIAGKFREFMIIGPTRDIIREDMSDLSPWEDPLESKCPLGAK